MIKETRDV